MKLKVFRIAISLYLIFFVFENKTLYSFEKELPVNILDYSGDIKSPKDRHSLAFSDQGAWFAFGFPVKSENYGGFTGPFLMTQENGVWCSKVLCQLKLKNLKLNKDIEWNGFDHSTKAYNSHLEQTYKSSNFQIRQILFFSSAHTAFIITKIKNISNKDMDIQVDWGGKAFLKSLKLKGSKNGVHINSSKSNAIGYIQVFGDLINKIEKIKNSYSINLKNLKIKPGQTKELILSQSFIFPEYIKNEQKEIENNSLNLTKFLENRIKEKKVQLKTVYKRLKKNWSSSIYKDLITKAILTLQNNWRIPAGELKHSGLFPSYHYKWFHGFWAWDSWKHSVALAEYDNVLAKEQIRAMFDFMDEEGFITDCVYRDTSIEKHNYRNTKPPLSAWAVWSVYSRDKDLEFLRELYPKIKKQHYWWYRNRDHDKDGVCEYGSTDGTLKAAKWESGMDNAVRFDKSKMLKNSGSAYSLDQESVDLNSYLYAEKDFLTKIAFILKKNKDAIKFKKEAESLKIKIQKQFFDDESGWFYDTDLSGKNFIKVMGCEGWIPLWAEAATKEQAKAVKDNMMNEKYFNLKVPFQTLSASHPKFKPDRGYWRGPVWLDQAYFGVSGLEKYNFNKEAESAIYKLINNAEGVLGKGRSIRENYQPLTGLGLESKNFSWSAAHYILMLIGDK